MEPQILLTAKGELPRLDTTPLVLGFSTATAFSSGLIPQPCVYLHRRENYDDE